MAFTAKSLADGQLPSSQGAVYTVPGSTKAYVRNLFLYNTNAASQTITLWVKRSGGTARKFRTAALATDESADVLESPLVLSAGDSIEAVTTTATAVDYFIAGVEET